MWTVRQNQFKWQDFSFMNRGGGWFWIFWFKLWKDNVRDCGGRREAQREEAGPSCLALSNDLCIMKDGNNISHSLQGFHTVTRFAYSYIFPFTSPSLLHCKLFFLWAGHLPPWHRSGRGKFYKYVQRDIWSVQMPVKIWKYGTVSASSLTPIQCSPRFKDQEAVIQVKGKEHGSQKERNLW